MATLLFDIEAYNGIQPIPTTTVEPLRHGFVLRWIDPAYHDQSGPVADFERSREFRYPGAAIAWARRQIFHGRVYGGSIELEDVYIDREGERLSNGLFEITLAGFCRWEGKLSKDTYRLGAPSRKCRLQL